MTPVPISETMDQNPELATLANQSRRAPRSLSKTLTLAVVIATCMILVITIWFSYSQARNALGTTEQCRGVEAGPVDRRPV